MKLFVVIVPSCIYTSIVLPQKSTGVNYLSSEAADASVLRRLRWVAARFASKTCSILAALHLDAGSVLQALSNYTPKNTNKFTTSFI